MAWDRKPLPGTPLRREVMGRKLNRIASGADGTVRSHSQWLSANASPPLLVFITVIPCRIPCLILLILYSKAPFGGERNKNI